MAQSLGKPAEVVRTPARPDREADLEEIRAYVSALCKQRDALDRERYELSARAASRQCAAELAGETVLTQSAEQALARHEAECKEQARTALAAHRDAGLERVGLNLSELPGTACHLIEVALAQAHRMDQGDRVTRWIVHEHQRRTSVEQALALLQSTPNLVHEDKALAWRWINLTAQLQHIASGLGDFSPMIEREYRQICDDARRWVNSEFTKVDWAQNMREQGFEALEREDGQGLVVVDLENLDVWLEVEELETEHGGYAALLELKTDDRASTGEAAVTDSICSRLARVAGASADHVAAETEVIERKPSITRGRRPARAQKSFAKSW